MDKVQHTNGVDNDMGMKENLHSDEFQKVLTMNDLFVENTEDS